MSHKLLRITTVPLSLKTLLKGQLRYMSRHGFEVTGISSDGNEMKDALQNEGVRIIPVEMTRAITPLKDLKTVWQLYWIMKKEKPKIVHTHTPKAGTAGMLAAKLAGVPLRLHTVAGLPLLEASGRKRKLLDWVEKMTYACATHVYPNSFGLKDIIVANNYTSAKKLNVIGNGSSNGIDTSHFSPVLFSEGQRRELRQSLNIMPGDFVFTFVGRLVKDKGINELISAFSDLRSPFPTPQSPKLLLIGPFEKERDPISKESEAEIESNPAIIATGFQDDVRPFLAISDVFVFPSYREGFPNVVMQAGAMGLPAIVTDINGCNEIVVEGKNGLIIPPKHTDVLKQAMLKLLNDVGLRQELAANAREMIVSRYEQQVVWEALLNEYNGLLQDYTSY